ncbi:MAG: alpha/beta hydrolase [Dehalococcoidia bacterium]|nr:alpha/beta hydrolase [Dehalococcoidia bacterium]
MSVSYNPSSRFDIKSWDVEYRRDPVRALMARIYQPQGTGSFPVLLDVHGGAWNDQDRTVNSLVDQELAASGVLVVAIDLRLASEAPYPASVADTSYGIRWVKAKAQEWNGDPTTLGVLGSSSGGHVVELIAMRPNDPRYNEFVLEEAPGLDTTMNYVIGRSPISNTAARYENAKRRQRQNMMHNNETYFDPWDSIHEANPQEILDRGEQVSLPPMFILQGSLDDNVMPETQAHFVDSYRNAGGDIEFEVFARAEHRWVHTPSPETDRAIDMMKNYIASRLEALQPVA